MDEKTLKTLEFPKVIEKLAEYAAFSASADLARALQPAATLDEAMERQARTTEAAKLLSIKADVSVGGAHDIRPLVNLASRGGVLSESDLLAVSGSRADWLAAVDRFAALGADSVVFVPLKDTDPQEVERFGRHLFA
jgi:dsDNA-specific endonuclease/ATPase MutS2